MRKRTLYLFHLAIPAAGLLGFAIVTPGSPPPGCGNPPGTYARGWKADAAVAFQTAGLAVDADGAPNSYLIDGKGLSKTCDGVTAVVGGKRVTRKTDPAHWLSLCEQAWSNAVAHDDYSRVAIFGFLAGPHNRPLIQSAGDPLPGKAYITTTTLTIPGTPAQAQRHWVDATKIPYIVLPGAFIHQYGVAPGDVAVVYRPKTKSLALGIFADGGDLGEGSVKLHFDIGNNPIKTVNSVERATVGIPDRVITLVFPGVHASASQDAGIWNQSIQTVGKRSFEDWGGLTRMTACSSLASARPSAATTSAHSAGHAITNP